MHTDQHIKDAVNIFGYAYGYDRICKHFGEYKYNKRTMRVLQNSPASPVQMFYMEPEWYNLANMQDLRSPSFKKFHDHQYKIIGTHLEATRVWSHWIQTMNSVDEIWVGNQFAADAVINSGVTTPTFVFEHGIDDMWKPFKRGKGDKIRFLHVDSGSPRKRADLVEKAFLELFKNNKNVELTLKFHGEKLGNEFGVHKLFNEIVMDNNIRKIYKTLSHEGMIELFNSHDVLVYPSEGEGFGFIPLQALATGMPVISTGVWCSYEKYMKDNIIESTIGPTTYTGYFEGEVVLAEYDSLLYQMKKVYNDIDAQCRFYYKQAPAVYKEYNWQKKCDEMINAAIDRIGIDKFKPIKGLEEKQDRMITYKGHGTYAIGGYRFTPEDRTKAVPNGVFQNLVLNELFEETNL